MRSIMVGGPYSGRVLDVNGNDVCFAMPLETPLAFVELEDMPLETPMWKTAYYRRSGQLVWRGLEYNVFEFKGIH